MSMNGSINLLHVSSLEPRITSDTVSLDGHPVSNLLLPSQSSASLAIFNCSHSNAGFIAESFIKPPVNITITFARNVQLERVVINGCVGSQRSTSIEIYVASVTPTDQEQCRNYDSTVFQCIGRSYSAQNHKLAHESHGCGNNSRNDNQRNGRVDGAHGVIESGYFVFVNDKFPAAQGDGMMLGGIRDNIHKGADEGGFIRGGIICGEPLRGGGGGVYSLNHRMDRYLNEVSAVCIRVTRTANGSAVAVRSVEIWGQSDMTRTRNNSVRTMTSHGINSIKSMDSPASPERTVNSPERVSHAVSVAGSFFSTNKESLKRCFPADEKVSSSENQLTESYPKYWTTAVDMATCDSLCATRNTTNQLTRNDDDGIPPEFLDALTHDVMTCPVLLPGGQIVDQYTLDRYCEQEALWGRPPNDPFTGKAFTSSCRPLVNDILKTRIDRFALHDADKIWASRAGNRTFILGHSTFGGSGATNCHNSKLTADLPRNNIDHSVQLSKSSQTTKSENRSCCAASAKYTDAGAKCTELILSDSLDGSSSSSEARVNSRLKIQSGCSEPPNKQQRLSSHGGVDDNVVVVSSDSDNDSQGMPPSLSIKDIHTNHVTHFSSKMSTDNDDTGTTSIHDGRATINHRENRTSPDRDVHATLNDDTATKSRSRETTMSSSLSSALRATLSHLPSFTRATSAGSRTVDNENRSVPTQPRLIARVRSTVSKAGELENRTVPAPPGSFSDMGSTGRNKMLNLGNQTFSPSITCNQRPVGSQRPTCSQCGIAASSLYTLHCSHLICRDCLIAGVSKERAAGKMTNSCTEETTRINIDGFIDRNCAPTKCRVCLTGIKWDKATKAHFTLS